MFMDIEPSYLRFILRWITEAPDRAQRFKDLAHAVEEFLTGIIDYADLPADGDPSLPQRTRDYLANGASVGSRHKELFAAVCQFRDQWLQPGRSCSSVRTASCQGRPG